jgi:hypothetical protein
MGWIPGGSKDSNFFDSEACQQVLGVNWLEPDEANHAPKFTAEDECVEMFIHPPTHPSMSLQPLWTLAAFSVS